MSGKKLLKFVCFLIVLFSFGKMNAQDIAINEIMSSNNTILEDEDGDNEDWIEIYNYGTTTVNLDGFGLSDDVALPYKWIFPNTVLAPNSFLIVFASDKDRAISGQPLHTNFKISSGGEDIYLTNLAGNNVDTAPGAALDTDVSYGRQPNGTGSWLFFYTPTPNESNLGTGLTEPLSLPSFSHDSGLYTQNFNLTIANDNPAATIVYTLDGSEPDINNTTGTNYNYKNQYPYNTSDPFGTLLTTSYTSNIYTTSIAIVDRSAEPDKYTNINTRQHPIFIPPQPVRKAMVVKAKTFVNGVGSKTVSKNYFVWPNGNPYGIPVISLQMQENLLFDYNDGIYTAGVDFDTWRTQNPTNNQGFRPEWNNYWRSGRDWEYPMHIEVFEPDNFESVLNVNAGFRIHGNNSRALAIKNLRFYARSEYDENNIFDFNVFDEPIYQATNVGNTDAKRILMRGDGTGGPVFFDVVFNKVMQPVFSAGITRIKPAIHFVNGEFWGITALRDRLDNEHYALNFNLDADNIVIIDCKGTNCDLDEGDDADYDDYIAMRDYINNTDLSDDAAFAQAEALLDMESFIDHIVMQVFTADNSFERGYWKVRVPENDNFGDGRWRLNTQDFEAAMDINTDWLAELASLTINTANGKIFGNLLVNESFKHRFINRFADLLNTAFLPERFSEIVNYTFDEVSPYLTEDANRFPKTEFYLPSEKQELLNWGNNQPPVTRGQIQDQFALNGMYNLTLNLSNENAGYIKVNTVFIEENTPGVSGNPYPWTGIYYDEVPITLQAFAKTGYVFSHWSGDVSSTDEIITVNSSENMQIQANYVADETTQPVVYFWFLGSDIPNDTPLENLNSTYEIDGFTSAQIEYTSCLTGYPFNDQDSNWRKASMERRNLPTTLNYIPEANNNITYELSNMRAIQIKQPFQNNGLENIVSFNFSTANLVNINFSFAANSDGAANALLVEYWDGFIWTNAGLPASNLPLTADYQLHEIDFTNIPVANNNANFKVRIRFAGDNMTIDQGQRVHFNNIAVKGMVVLSNNSFTPSFTLKVYPNPTQNLLNIQSNEPIENIVIFNFYGQEVLKLNEVGEQSQISLENLPQGIYLMQASWNDHQKTVRVIKE